MKRHLNLILSIGLVIGSALMIIAWETYLDDKLNTVQVLVAAKNLEKNHVLQPGDIKIDKVKIEQVVDKPLSLAQDLIGKETSQYIPRGNQLTGEMIDKYGLEPNDDQLIFSIPREWIYSSPGSLRRKDRVFIYAVPGENKSFSENSPVPHSVSPAPREPILENIVVAFAKDSANQEVKSTNENDKRIDATGSINNLELVMTESEYRKMESRFLAGYKFNFAYR